MKKLLLMAIFVSVNYIFCDIENDLTKAIVAQDLESIKKIKNSNDTELNKAQQTKLLEQAREITEIAKKEARQLLPNNELTRLVISFCGIFPLSMVYNERARMKANLENSRNNESPLLQYARTDPRFSNLIDTISAYDRRTISMAESNLNVATVSLFFWGIVGIASAWQFWVSLKNIIGNRRRKAYENAQAIENFLLGWFRE